MTRSSRLLKPALNAVAQVLALTAFCVSPANALLFTETTDAGDSIGTAIDVGLGVDAIRGAQSGADNEDFFKLTFDANVLFTASDLVWDNPNNSNSLVQLLDMGGTLLSSCGNCFFLQGNAGTQILSASLSAGMYFLRIRDLTPGDTELGGYQLEFAPATVPEPSSFMLLGLGGLVVLAAGRRHKRRPPGSHWRETSPS